MRNIDPNCLFLVFPVETTTGILYIDLDFFFKKTQIFASFIR